MLPMFIVSQNVCVLHIVLQYLKVKCRQLCIHVSESSAGIFLDNYDKAVYILHVYLPESSAFT